ncbi:MAG: hydroxylamine reductase, partial [Gemmatimonadota bacterium]|nr:hydroxylamine reductase [Gemmatimonadota bacterium]
MFCYQCEQTAKGEGCTVRGVCGKDSETAALQDVLIHLSKGISQYAHRAAQLGSADPAIDIFVVKALFTTVTNVNFDPQTLDELIRRGAALKDRAAKMYEDACKKGGKEPETLAGPAGWQPADTTEGLIGQGEEITLEKRLDASGKDIAGLQELITYGLKGMAAYADHARILGVEDKEAYAFFHEALSFLADDPQDVNALVAMALRVGEVNLKVMGLLDEANTGAYGHPEPTSVRVTPLRGKCILVSGHDLKDLDKLLQQTEGKGINVYTHGEMLPCLAYPGLKKYSHLV